MRGKTGKLQELRMTRQKKEEEEGRKVTRRAMIMMREKEKAPLMKRERKGLRRMIGGERGRMGRRIECFMKR